MQGRTNWRDKKDKPGVATAGEAKDVVCMSPTAVNTAPSALTSAWISDPHMKKRPLGNFWLMAPLKIMNLSCCGCTRHQSWRRTGRREDGRGRTTAAARGNPKTILTWHKRDFLSLDKRSKKSPYLVADHLWLQTWLISVCILYF